MMFDFVSREYHPTLYGKEGDRELVQGGLSDLSDIRKCKVK